MTQHVLVLGSDRRVRDALEMLLLGRAVVRHAPAATEADGAHVDVVVVTDPGLGEHIRDVTVHPQLGGCAIVALTAIPAAAPAAAQVHVVDTSTPDVVDDLTERISMLLARRRHPAGAQASETARVA